MELFFSRLTNFVLCGFPGLKVSLLAGLVVAVVVLTVIFSKMENKSLHDTYMNNNNLSEWVDNV